MVPVSETVETEVSIDRETHQVLVSVNAPGVLIAVAFEPRIDDDILPTAVDELGRRDEHRGHPPKDVVLLDENGEPRDRSTSTSEKVTRLHSPEPDVAADGGVDADE